MPGVLSDLRPSWVAFGWFIGAAVTALLLLALASLGIAGDGIEAPGVWVAGAMALGFLAAGVMVGLRAPRAPWKHGVAIGLFSLVAWVAVNLFLGEPTDQTAWTELSTASAVSLLLLQTAATVVGARIGARWAGR